MAATRRPGSARRPATRSRATARTAAVPSRRTTPAVRTGPRGLTTRAAVLGLVVCGLLVTAALPLREHLAQRAEIAAAEEANAAARARVTELQRLQTRLNDPAYVKAEARHWLHFVMPGETAFQLIPERPASAAPTSAEVTAKPAKPMAAGPEAPWYSQLYGTVRAADDR